MANLRMFRYARPLETLLLVLLVSVQVMGTHAIWQWLRGARKPAKECSSKRLKRPEEVSKAGYPSRGVPYDMEATTALGSRGSGKELYERTAVLSGSGSRCWQVAYAGLAKSCREILRDESQKSRLALRLTDCFLKSSRRGGLPRCPDGADVSTCIGALDEHLHALFLAFYIDAVAICHYLQSQAFKSQTERLVEELKMSAQSAQSTLDAMQDKLDVRNAFIIDQAQHLLDVQKEMQKEHSLLQANIQEGMDGIHEATVEAQAHLQTINRYQEAISRAQQDLAESLASELYEFQLKTNQMETSMATLHVKVDDLMDKSTAGQEDAERGLSELKNLQWNALKETKQSMNRLVQDAHKRQEYFRDWQTELDRMNKRLADGSKHMIRVQEMFVAKQGEVFTTIERLFFLHNAVLVESRVVRTLILYFAITVVIFMATAPKPTRSARLILYFGLFLTLTFEIWLIRSRRHELNSSVVRFTWPPHTILWLRYSYGVLAASYLFVTYARCKEGGLFSQRALKDGQRMLLRKHKEGRRTHKAYSQSSTVKNVRSRANDDCDCEEDVTKSRAARQRRSQTRPSTYEENCECDEDVPHRRTKTRGRKSSEPRSSSSRRRSRSRPLRS